VARFQRLTRADLDTLTRGELIRRVEAEQQYWARKEQRGSLSDADQQARQEFSAILMQVVNPARLAEAMGEITAWIRGERAAPTSYWTEVPGQPGGGGAAG
jgi:hypothetical protein